MARATQTTAYATKGTDVEVAALDIAGDATVGATGALVALVGGAQAGTALSSTASRFVTVATAANSAQLPAAVAGLIRIVKNAAAANSMRVFPQTGEVINALAANAGFDVAAGKACLFVCITAGTWETILTA